MKTPGSSNAAGRSTASRPTFDGIEWIMNRPARHVIIWFLAKRETPLPPYVRLCYESQDRALKKLVKGSDHDGA